VIDLAAHDIDPLLPLPVALLVKLIRFGCVNSGENHTSPGGERPAAEWVAGVLRAAGYEPQVLARPDAPERANVVLRIPGSDAALPALLVHGHLDVVPADATEWTVDPFGGTIDDGYVIGRGSVDMLYTVAGMMAIALNWAEAGLKPRRDIVLAFVADEESGGECGARFLVEQHPELFAGCAAAIGEDGAAATPAIRADGRAITLYPIACAERGAIFMKLTAAGAAGHGSRPTADNAIGRLIDALYRLAHHGWPLQLSPVVEAQLRASADALGMTVDVHDEASVQAVIDQLGDAAGALRWTIRVSSTPTLLDAGYKVNVIPGVATAQADVRFPPGGLESTLAELARLIGPDVQWSYPDQGQPPQADPGSSWFAAMSDAIRRADPGGIVVPYCMGGSSDARSFATLGMQCYGFTPLTLDPQGRRPTGIHVVDERVPVASVVGGYAVLKDFLQTV